MSKFRHKVIIKRRLLELLSISGYIKDAINTFIALIRRIFCNDYVGKVRQTLLIEI